MIKHFFLNTFLLIFCAFDSVSQDRFPKDYFISPVDFPIVLSGTFAELRVNHFHSGIDITTQQAEGKSVYACADGYVSRIKISPYGFGKALYVTHPNGYTTVYAHLKGFNPVIGAWLKSEQYKVEQFDVDLFPAKDLLLVKKGEIICYSGNTGSSEGPHLHFEIRDSKTEKPVNPQLFGFSIKDFIRPVITSVRIYPEGNDSKILGQVTPYTPEIIGWGPVYRLKNQDTISIAGKFSIGLQCSDLHNGSKNKNGISRFAVFVDSVLEFDWQAETFAFAESRYINSFIDYSQYYKNGQRFIRTRIDPNNKLSMYKCSGNNGIFNTIPDSVRHVKIVATDANNNESVLRFVIRGENPDLSENQTLSENLIFSYLKNNSYATEGLIIDVPGNSLYDNLEFSCTVAKPLSFTCSPVFKIHNPEIPLHDYIDLTITIDSIYQAIGNSLTLVSLKPGRPPYSIGGQFDNGVFKVKIREFGNYTVMADTIAPVIKALNISNGKTISKQKTIKINISDGLSGIKSYKAYLNDKWILMDYDAKDRLLEYERDERLTIGTNKFLLVVEDYCGNTARYEATLTN